MKMKEKLWLWGQDAGTHHRTLNNMYRLPGVNKMGPREGCDFFGINKCCRVRLLGEPKPPFDSEAEKLKDLDEVVWSADSASTKGDDIDAVLSVAEKYTNITGAVLDDFFSVPKDGEAVQGWRPRHNPEDLRRMRGSLHGFGRRSLDLWLVWYTHQMENDIAEYLDPFDVITLWTWNGSDLPALEENFSRVFEKTPGKRHFAGCYMWNYGEARPMTMEQMKLQLDYYYRSLKKGCIEGIILCSNCIADIGLDTVEYTRDWIKSAGGEDV